MVLEEEEEEEGVVVAPPGVDLQAAGPVTCLLPTPAPQGAATPPAPPAAPPNPLLLLRQ